MPDFPHAITESGIVFPTGWIDDPNRHRVVGTLRYPFFSRAAPDLMGTDQDVYLYKAWKEVLGQYPGYVAQKIGDCYPPQTMVLMEDGTERPIEVIAIGDQVITHKGRPGRVTRTIRKPYSGDLVTMRSTGYSRSVTATPDHRLLARRSRSGETDWIPIGELRPRATITISHRSAYGSINLPIRLVGRDAVDGIALGVESLDRSQMDRGEVYCLEVEGDHSFVANGYASSNCTSFGAGHAIDLTEAIDIALQHAPADYKETSTEAVYGLGREVAGMLGSWSDGCYGAAVAKGLTDVGSVPRELVGVYSGQRAKEWGGKGVPKEIREACGAHKLGAASLVVTLDELDAALGNCYACTVASNQGFRTTRDADGLCAASGSWAHQMMIAGRRRRNDRRQYLICQSWGPDMPGGPLVDDQPPFSFWIWDTVMASMLAVRDSFAFSKFQGYQRRVPPATWSARGWLAA